MLAYVFVFHADGGDFYPNWRAARAVLDGMPAYARYDWPFPYLYPPGFLMPMLPLGMLDFHLANRVFFVINTFCLGLGTLLCMRLCRLRLRSPLTPLVLGFLSLTPPVLITLIQGNVNGLLLAGEGAFLLLASRNRWAAAGLALGLTLLVKPLLLPLLVVPILWRRFDALLLALVVPIGLSILAFPLLRDGTAFLTQAVPYLLRGETGNALGNTTIAGAFALLQLPMWSATLARILVVAAGCTAILRTPRVGELGLIHVTAVALLMAFAGFSFSSQYFALYLLPLVLSAGLPGAWMSGWLGWTGVYLVDGADLFVFYRAGKLLGVGPAIGTVRSTLGYLVLLIGLVMAAWRRRPARESAGPLPGG
ncbi:MAG TPA: glycosyltransferase family 87 protein [Candidatus Solibacter sp.]|nr:glycosyltransferase family 87 protein [Candidatus Solibacter sp.]